MKRTAQRKAAHGIEGKYSHTLTRPLHARITSYMRNWLISTKQVSIFSPAGTSGGHDHAPIAERGPILATEADHRTLHMDFTDVIKTKLMKSYINKYPVKNQNSRSNLKIR